MKPEVWDRMADKYTKGEPTKFTPAPPPKRKYVRKTKLRMCPTCRGRIGHFEGCRLIGKYKLETLEVFAPPTYHLVEKLPKKLTSSELLAKLLADRAQS